MESLSREMFIFIFLCSLVILPILGLLCGKLMTYFCAIAYEYLDFFIQKLFLKNNSAAWSIDEQNINVFNASRIIVSKIFYLLCALICTPVFLILVMIAAAAYFAPLLAFLAVSWNGVPVNMPALVIGSGILCLAYISTVCVAVYRYSE